MFVLCAYGITGLNSKSSLFGTAAELFRDLLIVTSKIFYIIVFLHWNRLEFSVLILCVTWFRTPFSLEISCLKLTLLIKVRQLLVWHWMDIVALTESIFFKSKVMIELTGFCAWLHSETCFLRSTAFSVSLLSLLEAPHKLNILIKRHNLRVLVNSKGGLLS